MLTPLNRSKWARFDSPDWSFVITSVLISLFLFGMLHRTWSRGNFALTDWPQSDGQFSYRLALNPFTSESIDYGIAFDRPAARQQRILYPLVVWLSAFGTAVFVPALLIFVNYFALCLSGWMCGLYVQSLKRHALWGLLLPWYPGFLTSLRCDSAEILELSLLLGSLLLLRRERHVNATLLLSLALLTRETALLAVLSAAFVYVAAPWCGRERTIKWFYFTVPLTVFAIWQVVLFYVWGTVAIGNNLREIGLPLAGFVRLLSGAVLLQTPVPLRTFVELILIVGFAVLVMIQLRGTAASLYERAAWVLYACWGFALNAYVWNKDWNFLRALSEFYVLGTIIIIGGKVSLKVVLGTGVIILWLCQVYRLLHYIP